MHTHDTSIWGCVTIAATTYYQEADRFLSPLPMFHVGALTPITLNVYRGITTIVMRSFDPSGRGSWWTGRRSRLAWPCPRC